MVTVYLKNGEKAPMPDADYVKIEAADDGSVTRVLRCFYGNTEVGHFKWDEVAGYTVSTVRVSGQPVASLDAWAHRLDGWSPSGEPENQGTREP